MLVRPTAKQFTAEDIQNISAKSIVQESGGGSGFPKSFDENFPVFDIPVDEKVLIYVPSHKMTYPDGHEGIRADIFNAHPVKDGNMYANIRCSKDIISKAYGLDGRCPLCEGLQDTWQLYNLCRDDIAKSKGIIKDEKNPEAFKEAMKEDSKKLLAERAIREAERWYVFPIVVIDCEEANGKRTTKPKKDENGQLSGTVYWYQIREVTYQNKWEKALSNAYDEAGDTLTDPAGQWIVLDFSLRDAQNIPKNDQKMRSAKDMTVTVRTMSDEYKAWADYFDKLTEAWDIAKAIETCSLDAIRSMDEMQADCDSLLQPTRDRITQFQLGGGSAAGAITMNSAPVGDINAQLANFGGGNNVGVTTE